MTGEISLRGDVLPVGGVKEKIIAAHRQGVSRVVIPAENERDLEDVPVEVRKALRVQPVETMAQALAAVFGLPLPASAPAPESAPAPDSRSETRRRAQSGAPKNKAPSGAAAVRRKAPNGAGKVQAAEKRAGGRASKGASAVRRKAPNGARKNKAPNGAKT
jgi:predicted S18 family serine protease